MNQTGPNSNNTYQYSSNNLAQSQYSAAAANSNNSFWWSKFQHQQNIQQITPTQQNGNINGTNLPYPSTNYSTPTNYANTNSLDGIHQYNNLLRNLHSKSSSSTSSSPNSSSSSNSSMSNSLTSHLNSLVEHTNNYHHLLANGHALPMTPESNSNTHDLSPTSYSSARQNKHEIQNSK